MYNLIINVNPVAFHLGPVPISWYFIMIGLAVLTLIGWTLLAVRRGANLTYRQVFIAALIGIPCGLIGARLLHVIDYQSYFRAHPMQILTGYSAGFAIYGAVLGAALGIWVYSRITRKDFAYFLDVIAPGIILAQAIGRVGCTLNGCCYGNVTDVLFAITYVHGNEIVGPVIPTQIYEILFDLVVFGGLLKLRDRLLPKGSLFIVYLAAYSAWRFGIDFIRPNPIWFWDLHESQIIAAIVFVFSVMWLIRKAHWVSKDTKNDGPTEEGA